MIWSNWQKAIGRGAVMTLLCWAGLAWTQSPEQRLNYDTSERIMVVHENGKSTRCKVVETWQLPDRRVANLLQALETSELITIVDDYAPPEGGPLRGMPKRIFAWGVGQRTPPDGSPVPPLRGGAGLVIRNEVTPPAGSIAIENRIKEQPQSMSFAAPRHDQVTNYGSRPGGLAEPVAAPAPKFDSVIINQSPASQKNEHPFPRLHAFLNKGNPEQRPTPAPASQVQFGSGQQNPTPSRLDFAPTQAPTYGSTRNTDLVGGTNPAASMHNQWPPAQPTGPAIGTNPPASAHNQWTPTQPSAGVFGTKAHTPLPRVPEPYPAPFETGPVAGAFEQPRTASDPSPFTPPPPPPGFAAQPAPQSNPNQVGKLPYSGILGVGTKPNPQQLGTHNTGPFTPPVAGTLSMPISNPGVDTALAAPLTDPNLAKTAPTQVASKAADPNAKKAWKPGDMIQSWLKPNDPPAKPFAKNTEQRNDDLLNNQNKIAQRQLEQRVEQIAKTPFSTAMANTPLPNKPKAEPKKAELSIPPLSEERPIIPPPPLTDLTKIGPPPMTDLTKIAPPPLETRDPWGKGQNTSILPPGMSLLDPAVKPAEIVKLPAPAERRNDPLLNPDRITAIPKPPALLPAPTDHRPPVKHEDAKHTPPLTEPSWPLNSGSTLAARNGLQGPIVYVPYPVLTQPYPHMPPPPPIPQLPSAPELNLYVNNAFSPPPTPKGATVASLQAPAVANAFMNPHQQMIHQQMMMQQQQMLAQQQQMLAQQQMMAFGNPMMPYMTPMQPAGYRAPMPSNGPMTNFSRSYAGPTAPNPAMYVNQQMPMPYPSTQPSYGMMPQQPVQPVNYQQPQPAQQLEQLLRVLRESPHPVQREWSAQSLSSYDWRANPQIVPALLQSATQDPAGSVRARSVMCLGRIGAAVEPVLGTLHALRNDIDPRVRQEVEQAFMNLGQAPMMPHGSW